MDNKTILFFGGSITCGFGASSYDKAWAKIAYNGISKELFGENVRMVNASISGTGSYIGVFRLAEQALIYKPDMAFIEFAVNDSSLVSTDPELIIGCYDYLVRALIKQNPNIAITFVYTTAKGHNAMSVQSIVAKHYGIPEIDLQTPACELVKSGEKEWVEIMADGVHPTDFGHALYGETVVKTILADKERFLAPIKAKESISKIDFNNPKIVSPENALDLGGFVYCDVEDNASVKRIPEVIVKKAAVSSKIGDTMRFEFMGNHFGVYNSISNYGGRFSVKIDGKECGVGDCYYKSGDGTEIRGQFLSKFRIRDLGEGKHVAEVTVIEPNENSRGSLVQIAGFFVDEG